MIRDLLPIFWRQFYAAQFKWKKSAQRDANTARALAVSSDTARCHKPTDRTDYNTLHRS